MRNSWSKSLVPRRASLTSYGLNKILKTIFIYDIKCAMCPSKEPSWLAHRHWHWHRQWHLPLGLFLFLWLLLGVWLVPKMFNSLSPAAGQMCGRAQPRFGLTVETTAAYLCIVVAQPLTELHPGLTDFVPQFCSLLSAEGRRLCPFAFD